MTNAVDLPTVTYYQVLGMVHSQPNPLLVQLLYTLYITFSFLAVKMQKKNNPECQLFVYKKCPSTLSSLFTRFLFPKKNSVMQE